MIPVRNEVVLGKPDVEVKVQLQCMWHSNSTDFIISIVSSCDDNDDETEMSLLTSHLSLSLEGGSTGGHFLWSGVGGAKYFICRRQRHMSEEECKFCNLGSAQGWVQELNVCKYKYSNACTHPWLTCL